MFTIQDEAPHDFSQLGGYNLHAVDLYYRSTLCYHQCCCVECIMSHSVFDSVERIGLKYATCSLKCYCFCYKLIRNFCCFVLRMGRKPALMIATTLMIVGGFMCAFAPGYWLFAIGRFLGGCGRVASYACAICYGRLKHIWGIHPIQYNMFSKFIWINFSSYSSQLGCKLSFWQKESCN